MSYDAATHRCTIPLTEAEACVGKPARLTLTGKVSEVGQSASGTWGRFEIDKRWGFPAGFSLVLDLDQIRLDDV